LKEFKGVSIDPKHVETNIVIFDVANTGMTALQVAEAMKKESVFVHAFGKTQIRLVTHLDVTAENIEKALKTLGKVFGKSSRAYGKQDAPNSKRQISNKFQ
jgi:threonine aldolase